MAQLEKAGDSLICPRDVISPVTPQSFRSQTNALSGSTLLHQNAFRTPYFLRAQELCGSRGGRPGLPKPNKPTVSVDVKQHSANRLPPSELRSCVKVEVAVQGSPSQNNPTVSVDVKQRFNHLTFSTTDCSFELPFCTCCRTCKHRTDKIKA